MSSTEPQPKSRAVKKVKEPKAKVVDVSWKLYEAVIDETIARIKPEFVQDGVDESVLDQLRSLWEQNIYNTGVLGKKEDRIVKQEAAEAPEGSSKPQKVVKTEEQAARLQAVKQEQQQQQQQPAGVHAPPSAGLRPPQTTALAPQFIMPQGVQPAAMMMAPQQHVVTMAPQQQPMFMMPGAQGLMGQQGFYLQNAAALQMYAGAMQQIRAPGMVMPGGMPGILPVPGVTLAAPPPLSTAPLPAEGDRKRPLDAAAAAHGAPAPKQQHTGPPAGTIPQRDGPADDAPAGPSEGAPGSASVGGGGDDLGDDDEDDFHAELNEGDDLADVDDHGEIDEESITNVVLGQFDKVQRSKAKWRINLKNCVATLKVKGEDGREETRDYVFKKVTGEMNFS